MDLHELKLEQRKLAQKIQLQDAIKTPTTIAGAITTPQGNKLKATITVLTFPELTIQETTSYTLDNPLPFSLGFQAYREMPAIIEAFNQLDEEPDLLIIKGLGINHPRRLGMASHIGLSLNIPTIGVTEKNISGSIEDNKITTKDEITGFQLITKEHAKPIFVSPGYKVSLGTSLQLIKQTIKPPHKLPEPLHLARKHAKK